MNGKGSEIIQRAIIEEIATFGVSSINFCLIERAKQAHSLVMTFDIYIFIYVRQWRSYLEYRKSIVKGQNRTAHVLPAQQYLKIKGTEAERETGTACGRNQV